MSVADTPVVPDMEALVLLGISCGEPTRNCPDMQRWVNLWGRPTLGSQTWAMSFDPGLCSF